MTVPASSATELLADDLATDLSLARLQGVHRESIVRPHRTVAIEFLRYFLGSGGALAIDVGLYRLALHLGLAYTAAAPVGFCAGAVFAYVVSVAWVFQTRAVRSAAIEFGLFVAVGVAGLVLTEALLWLQIERFGVPTMQAKLGAAGMVFVFNFVVRKSMLFSEPVA